MFLRERLKGQANKGAGRMPWHWEPMKDVISCDKPRGGAKYPLIRGSLNGATHWKQFQYLF